MSDGRPWDVPEDLQYILWLIRRARRLIMRVEGEPERKGRGGKRSAVAFQQQVMDEMERYGRYPMTGPLALDLHFTAARRNPASIHHIAKHALDILGVVLPGNERPRRRGVLYRDDRQVKFLYVDLNQAWQPDGEEGGRTGSTFIIAQRARDVMADFCMAGRLDRERLYEDEESPFVVPDLPDEPEPDWLTAPGSALTATERFFAEETRFHDTRSLQDALLARTRAPARSVIVLAGRVADSCSCWSFQGLPGRVRQNGRPGRGECRVQVTAGFPVSGTWGLVRPRSCSGSR